MNFAVAISRTVQITLLLSSQIIARDYDSIRMRVGVEVHEFRFAKRGLDRVIAGRLVRRVPISCSVDP